MHGLLQNLALFSFLVKFNVSSVVKVSFFPVCWYKLMRPERIFIYFFSAVCTYFTQ
jgi:hypothetical protein